MKDFVNENLYLQVYSSTAYHFVGKNHLVEKNHFVEKSLCRTDSGKSPARVHGHMHCAVALGEIRPKLRNWRLVPVLITSSTSATLY